MERLACIGLGSLSLHPAEPVSLHAGRYSGAGDHDEPEPPGHEGPAAWGAGLRCQPARRVRNSRPGKQVESDKRQDCRCRGVDPAKALASDLLLRKASLHAMMTLFRNRRAAIKSRIVPMAKSASASVQRC